MVSHLTRILVTGGEGILATALQPYFPFADYRSHWACDVTNAQSVRKTFQETQPELVIHCAAITSHNAEPMAYVMGNIQGTVNVVAAAKKLGSRVVYLSTDYLGARGEGDAVKPVNDYAASKYAGECAVLSAPNSLVVRGSWYSRLDLSHAATDAVSSKLNVDRAAHLVACLSVSTYTGVVNIGGQSRSIYEIALQFNERVIPVSRHQIHCGYEIPANCSLDTTRMRQWLNISH